MDQHNVAEAEFIRELRTELVEFVRRRGWPLSDAEDLAQAALVEVVARRAYVRNPRAYVYRIVRRRLAALVARRRRELAAGLGPPDGVVAEDQYHQGDVNTVIRELLTIIWRRPRQRGAMSLAFDGYPSHEIADKLDMTSANVRGTLRHARKT